MKAEIQSKPVILKGAVIMNPSSPCNISITIDTISVSILVFRYFSLTFTPACAFTWMITIAVVFMFFFRSISL